MKDKLRNLIAMLAAVGASLPWGGIIPSALALLGLAGSATATLVAGWMSPALIALSFVLLGRSFYILYVQKRGTRPVEILTWLSATLVVCFWTWKLAVPPTEDGSSAPVKAVSATVANFHRVTLHVKDMCKQLNITGRDGPNRVQEALSGLPGITTLDVDFQTDRFHVTFDLNKVTPEDMLETVRKQGLEGDIVHDEFR